MQKILLALLTLALALISGCSSISSSAPEEISVRNDEIAIVFLSDDTTWVSALGPTQVKPDKFFKRKVFLKEGDYKVIGRRWGYKDIAIILKIRLNRTYEDIDIRCRTKGRHGTASNGLDWGKVQVIEGSED